MRILVTGTTGFIGSNLYKKLQEENHKVVSCKRNFHEFNQDGKIDVLFHQAAIVRKDSDEEIMFINHQAAIELFKKVISQGCKRIIYASSTAVYGNTKIPFVEGRGEKPLDAYGKSKLLLDQDAMKLAEEHPQVRIVGLRYCNVFGGGKDIIHQLIQQVLHSQPQLYNDGEQKRDYIYIRDVLNANICALNAKESCVLNCGSGESISYNKLVEVLNNIIGKNKKIEYIGNPPESFQINTECDITKAKEKINFIPQFNFVEGINDYLKTKFEY